MFTIAYRRLYSAQWLIAAGLATACADANVPTIPTSASAPDFAAANAPPESGPNVLRGPFIPTFTFAFDGDLVVAVGYEEPFAEHCADFLSPNQPGSGQFVFTPAGGAHFRESGRNLDVVVFQFAGEVVDPCEDLADAPVVATGTGDLTLASNDLFAGGAGPGADQLAATVNGVVTLTSGGQARLHVSVVTLFKPDGSFAFDHTRIVLRPIR
jgi:hypothetical protein